MKNWHFTYYQHIGPLFDDDGNNVDGKVKDFIQIVLEEAVKEVNELWRKEMLEVTNKHFGLIEEKF